MAPVAERNRSGRSSRTPPALRPWWGYGRKPADDGPAPHLRWPGVTIEIPAVWNTRRERWESPDGRFYFDSDEANRATEFFPDLLVHHIGEFAGEPFVLRPDQAMLIVRPLFGWKRASDGLRRFRKVFAFCPKGWGKSPLGAGLGLYAATCDGESASEVYAVAADRKQARVVHDNAKVMVESSPLLSDGAEITKDAITWIATHSTYQVLSADASTKHGFRPHVVIFDELHAQKNRSLYEALKKSMVKRRQPIMIIITHAGDDDEGICFEEYEYSKNVLSGTNQDDSCLPVIFEAQPSDDWTDPAVWKRVNPGHGVTVKHDAIAMECQEAINEPRKRNDFLRYTLNRWVNQATAWIPVDWWDACKEPFPSDDVLSSLRCAIGIDMSQKLDLSSAVAVFRQPLHHMPATTVEVVSSDDPTLSIKRTLTLNYRLILVPAFWLPDETLRERVAKDRVPYDIWEEEGLLRVTDGFVIDSDAIVRYVAETLPQRFPLIKQAEVGYDPAFATEVGKDLRDARGFQAVEVLQNYKGMNEACHAFEALVKAGRIVHGGNRMLRWNVENVAIKTDDAGRIRPVKPRSQTKRIDGVVATLIALSVLLRQPEPSQDFDVMIFGGRS